MFEHGGLWVNRNEVDSALRDMSKTKAITAKGTASHQNKDPKLQFRTNIMLTKACLQELRTTVLTTVSQAEIQDLLEISLHPKSVVGIEFTQRCIDDDGRTQWYKMFETAKNERRQHSCIHGICNRED